MIKGAYAPAKGILVAEGETSWDPFLMRARAVDTRCARSGTRSTSATGARRKRRRRQCPGGADGAADTHGGFGASLGHGQLRRMVGSRLGVLDRDHAALPRSLRRRPQASAAAII